jgi:hypothetical protein
LADSPGASPREAPRGSGPNLRLSSSVRPRASSLRCSIRDLHLVSIRTLGAVSLASVRGTLRSGALKSIRKGTSRRFKTHERKAPVSDSRDRDFSRVSGYMVF